MPTRVSYRDGLSLALVLASLVDAAAAPATLTPGPTVELHRAGLRFNPPTELSMMPRPPPTAYPAIFPGGDRNEEVYKPMDLWYAEQSVATFVNDGCRLTVARLADPPVAAVELAARETVSEPAYRQHRGTEAPVWDDDGIAAWIRAYSGRGILGFEAVDRNRSFRYPCREYTLEVQTGTRTRAFLVRLPARSAQRYVWFHFDMPGQDLPADIDTPVNQCMRSVLDGTIRSGDRDVDLQFQRLATRDGVSRNDAFTRTRNRVVESIRGMDDWWYVELPNYIMASNLAPGNRRLVRELQGRLEQIRTAYMNVWPPWAEIRDISVVRVFQTRDQYRYYVGPDLEWTTGVWMPGRKELIVSPEPGRRSGARTVGREQVLNTTYHEAFHQYIFYALDKVHIPLWMNEGHASLFEACRFQGGDRIQIVENDNALRVLDQARASGVHLDVIELMYMTPSEFYMEGRQGPEAEFARSLRYASAWALVYFLRKAAPVLHADQRYTSICDRSAAFLRESPGQFTSAMDYALDGVDRATLRSDVASFWSAKSKRTRAERNRIAE